MNILKWLSFSMDFKIEIHLPSSMVLPGLSHFLKTDRYTSGDVEENKFAFMHKGFQAKFNPYSFILFDGYVEDKNNLSILTIRARLSKPMKYFYIIGMTAIVMLIVFNVGVQDKHAQDMVILNPVFFPIWIYLFLLVGYLIKFKDVKVVLYRFKSHLESKAGKLPAGISLS